MTDAELLLLEAAEHRRLLELHRKTGAECFREAAAKLRAGGVRERILLQFKPRVRRGRKKTSGDENRLMKMALLLLSKEARSANHAAELVAMREPGHSRTATRERLGKAFRGRKAELMEHAGISLPFLHPPPACGRSPPSWSAIASNAIFFKGSVQPAGLVEIDGELKPKTARVVAQ